MQIPRLMLMDVFTVSSISRESLGGPFTFVLFPGPVDHDIKRQGEEVLLFRSPCRDYACKKRRVNTRDNCRDLPAILARTTAATTATTNVLGRECVQKFL
ncbi:unnamed protein product [Taenia asiatica]|uniref:Secreted protein n=1 Tax=Taenia asiatica TaxID=60517 RepID=A0A0R3W5A4_TAEAS|nr:unnamed protein product [Taenia asiatica]